MKNLFYLFSILFIFSCQSNESNQNKNTTEVKNDTPVQWVSYEGKQAKKNKKVVLVSGDEEYRSEEALPMLAKILANHHGFDCTVLFAQDPEHPGIIDPNYVGNIPGLEALGDADLMILFTRFRALPDDQMVHLKNYLQTGKPVFGIRTATHAFNFKDTTHSYANWGNYYKKEGWEGGFGQKVLGVNWYTHHGHHKHQSTKGIFAPGAADHPITKGIEDGAIWGSTDVYGVPLPQPAGAKPIILGQTMNRAGEYDENDIFYGMKESDSEVANVNPASKNKYNPNDPLMPIVWTKPYELEGGKEGLALTSTIGASSDLLDEDLRRLFVNGVYWLLDLPVPEKANVNTVGNYSPSQYSFHDDAYWENKNLKVADLVE